MGNNGIRPGDWVEINGVGGEVMEVGMLHTVILETGSWADAGHPTGRKVTFVNSFAIEGHYFNFSTSGQWLWDELQVVVPIGRDPYPSSMLLLRSGQADRGQLAPGRTRVATRRAGTTRQVVLGYTRGQR